MKTRSRKNGKGAFMISAWNFKKVESVMEARPREMCLAHIYCTTLSRMFVRILPFKRSKLWITDNSAKLPQTGILTVITDV